MYIWFLITKRLAGMGAGEWGTGWGSTGKGNTEIVAVALRDQKVPKAPLVPCPKNTPPITGARENCRF